MNAADCEDNEIMFRSNLLKQMTKSLEAAPSKANLRMIGQMYGVKRRWFGLESDRSLQKRIRNAILATSARLK